MELTFFLIALAAVSVAAYTDIRTREVPDWLSYGLIVAGLGTRTIWSLHRGGGEHIAEGLAGLAAMYGLAYVMFYTGQWGGGDSKLLMGLGAVFGLELSLDSFLIALLINTFLLGAIIGLAWSMALAVRAWPAFAKEWRRLRKSAELNLARIAMLAMAGVGIAAAFIAQDKAIRAAIVASILFLIALFYTFIFTKAVERACMRRWVEPAALTEGDWIVEDVVVGGKRLCGPKDLGVSKEQIAEMVALRRSGKLGKVLMKVGIPFVPSFLAGLLAAWFYGNLFMPALALFI